MRAARAAIALGALAVAAAATFAPLACNDGGGITKPVAPRAGLSPAVASVTAPVSALSHPQLIRNALPADSLAGTTSVLPVHFYSSFDVGQKPSEFVEGAIFVGLVSPGGVTGTVRLVASGAGLTTHNNNLLYWPPASAPSIGPVRGLAIDILEYDATGLLNGFDPSEGLLKGRLWAAAGTRLHVLAGRGDVASRAAVQLAELDVTAQLPAGESLTALCAAPPNLVLFAATPTRVLRIVAASNAALSTVEVFADIPNGGDGQSIFALAADGIGRLYVARRAGAGGASSFKIFEAATLAAAPAPALDFTPTGATLATPTAISVNSANHLVVGESATGKLYELDPAGALVEEVTILTTATVLPNFPTAATAAGFDTTAPLPANQLAAFYCDVWLSRIVLVTVPPASNGSVRTLANPTFRGGVFPILQNRCVFCHSSATPLGGLDLSGPPEMVHARLLGRACETFAADDPARPAECPPLPVQNPFFRNDVPVTPTTTGVLTTPGATCPNCPFPEPLNRIEPGLPTASYAIRKLLASGQTPLLLFPPLPDPIFTNNCGSDTDAALEAGEVCGERMPLASFLPRPARRAEIEMIEKWIRRGAPED